MPFVAVERVVTGPADVASPQSVYTSPLSRNRPYSGSSQVAQRPAPHLEPPHAATAAGTPSPSHFQSWPMPLGIPTKRGQHPELPLHQSVSLPPLLPTPTSSSDTQGCLHEGSVWMREIQGRSLAWELETKVFLSLPLDKFFSPSLSLPATLLLMGDTGMTLVGLGLPICTEQLFPRGNWRRFAQQFRIIWVNTSPMVFFDN